MRIKIRGCCPSTAKARSRLYRKNATSIVGRETSRARLPATFVSIP
jgi:hypothetical protein